MENNGASKIAETDLTYLREKAVLKLPNILHINC